MALECSGAGTTPIWIDMTIEKWGQPPEVFRLHAIEPIGLCQHFLHQKRIDMAQYKRSCHQVPLEILKLSFVTIGVKLNAVCVPLGNFVTLICRLIKLRSNSANREDSMVTIFESMAPGDMNVCTGPFI